MNTGTIKIFKAFPKLSVKLYRYAIIRDRPFNLQGGLWFFVLFRIFFLDNTRVRILIFLSRKAQIFPPEFNIRLYDKISDSDYFFFPPQKSEYFYQQHWESEYFFLEKNHNPPLEVKWSVPNRVIDLDTF